MKTNEFNADPKQPNDVMQKEKGKAEFKNQNPNQHHNAKKVALGPNTKR